MIQNILILTLVLNNTFNQIDKISKDEKRIIDSLTKAYNRNVLGYTVINGKITHLQFVRKGKWYELPLIGFRIERPLNYGKRKNT